MRVAIAALPLMLALGACGGASNNSGVAPPAADENNILHISWGGIALAEPGDAKRHWSTWTINLVDGSTGYGWASDADVKFPHTLDFELAGEGRIRQFVVDTRFEPVMREDGSASQTPEGTPVRKFAVLGSTQGAEGPWTLLYEGEARKDSRNIYRLDKEANARWLRLRIDSNWAGSGATRLAEFEGHGDLEKRGVSDTPDASGVYAHEYGPIAIRQDGNEIFGCYNDGLGTLRGTIFGRIMRLAWYSKDEQSIGAATLVPAHGKLYGFWYRYSDKMGSPWNATRSGDLSTAAAKCRAALFPAGNSG